MTSTTRTGDLVGEPPEPTRITPDASTAPFWEAAREHRLVIPRCGACGTHRMPPTPCCHVCQGTDVRWTESAGWGTLYSFTVVHTRVREDPAAAPSRPTTYVMALVELDDVPGVRLVTNIVEVAAADLTIGMPLAVRWHDAEVASVPWFVPADRAS